MKKLLISCMVTGICLGGIQTVSASTPIEKVLIEKEANEVETYADLAFLKEKLDVFDANNTTATERERTDYLNSVIQTDGFQNQRKFRSGIYLPGYNNLNSSEIALTKENPVIAVAAYAWADEATTRTKRTYGKNGFQDNSDAFRHGCWNILMRDHIGFTWAMRWATAHEAESSGVDRTMDLRNNKIGRDSHVSGKTDDQLANIILFKVNTGKMWRISGGQLLPTYGGRMRTHE